MTPLKVLIVEDSALPALDLKECCEAFGCAVVGPAGSIGEARALMQAQNVDLALLDINVRGERSFELAAELMGRGLPFAFLTGYTADSIPEEFSNVRVIEKPVNDQLLNQHLTELSSLATAARSKAAL